MKQTYLLSYPRSGSTWTSFEIFKYCRKIYRDKDIDIVEPEHRSHLAVGPFSWCEYYRHCEVIPCPDSREIAIQKSHDLNFRLKYQTKSKYVILIRNPIYSIPSWYEWSKSHYWSDKGMLEEPWEEFALKRAKKWVRFTKKWVMPKYKNALYIHYELLYDDTDNQFKKIINFLGLPLRKTYFQFNAKTPKSLEDIPYDVSDIEEITSKLYLNLLTKV